MFEKKIRCPKCDEQISSKFNFCPFCGLLVAQKKDLKRDYGLLGKSDVQDNFFSEPVLGFGTGMLNKMLSSTMNMLQKELKKGMRNAEDGQRKQTMPKTNFKFYVNGRRIALPEIGKINEEPEKIFSKRRMAKFPAPSNETIIKSIKLPRQEAKTSLKRLADKIVYEIDVPGADSMDRILISKLEDSIEIKAFAKDRVLTKTLPVKLALLGYYLENQKLFLEFQGK